MGSLVNMTAQRHNYDDDTGTEQGGDAERPTKKQKRNASTGGSSLFKTLLIAGGTAVAAVIAVDFYRKVKGEGGGAKEEAPGQPQIALPPQTFVPMPMPFPMPMPGYGSGYGAPPAPSRRISAEEEEKMLREEMQRMLMRRKVGRDVQKAKVELLMEELLEE